MTETPPTDSAHADAQQAQTNERVAKATGILALGNILSRILGLMREIVLSNIFGASRALEAFNNALVISKSLYDLLLAGHVNSAIIPVLSEVVTVKGRDELWRVLSILANLITVIATVLVAVMMLLAPEITSLISGSDPATQALSVDLLRFTAPALIFMCLFAVFSGGLYALRQFSLPALAGAVFNGSIVGVTVLFIPALELVPHLTASGGVRWAIERPTAGIYIVALSWIVASVAQMLLQIWGLRHGKLGLGFQWRHPAIRRIGLLYLPVLFSLVIDTLVIRLFSYNLASHADIPHGNNYMNWATTLIQFPQGLVATAISVAILPTLARQASLLRGDSATATQNRKAFNDTLGLGMRLAGMLIIPATVGLFVLAIPIIGLIFEHGAFTHQDTLITAQALRLYLLGLPFAALDLLLVYAFYARQDTVTPAVIGVVSLGVYMLVAVVLQPTFGLYSLMLADSVKHLVHALISAYFLARRWQCFEQQGIIATLIKATIAAAVMGVGAWLAYKGMASLLPKRTLINESLIVLVSGGVGGMMFITLARILKIHELVWLMGLVRQRIFAK